LCDRNRFNEKYSKDLVATKKKLTEAQARIAVLEKQVRTSDSMAVPLIAMLTFPSPRSSQVKQSNKEREVAVAVLSQFKSSGAQQEGHSRMQEQLLQGEVQDLQKRCVFLYVSLHRTGFYVFSLHRAVGFIAG
jgi:hypothetical protein